MDPQYVQEYENVPINILNQISRESTAEYAEHQSDATLKVLAVNNTKWYLKDSIKVELKLFSNTDSLLLTKKEILFTIYSIEPYTKKRLYELDLPLLANDVHWSWMFKSAKGYIP